MLSYRHMNKIKKLITTLLFSGAIVFGFTACGGGGGGADDGESDVFTPSAPSLSASLPSSLVGRSMKLDGWSFAFGSSTVAARSWGETAFGASVIDGSGSYLYNPSTKVLNIAVTMGPNREYRYVFKGKLSNVKKSNDNTVYSAWWSYSRESTLPGGTTIRKESGCTVTF